MNVSQFTKENFENVLTIVGWVYFTSFVQFPNSFSLTILAIGDRGGERDKKSTK